MGQGESVEGIDGGHGGGEEKEKIPVSVRTLPEEFTRRFEVLEEVGKGSYGYVYKVKDTKTKAIYAAKHLEYNSSNMKEVRIQAGVEDEHVVKIYDTITLSDKGQMFIVMEYCEGGNLQQWIKRSRRHKLRNQTVILQMLFGICQAVYNCHLKKIIHRDIKPENVLLDSKRRIKLADFGVARVLNRASYADTFCGTPPYMAPELFLSYLGQTSPSSGYDSKCDVWSIGCILWDMANDKNKFVFQLGRNLGHKVSQATDSLSASDISELIDNDVPQEYTVVRRLLHMMLKKNMAERASLSDILQDTELNTALQNPLDGHWSDIYDSNDV